MFGEAHMGLTTKGCKYISLDWKVKHLGISTFFLAIGASSANTLDDCVNVCQAITDAARVVNPDVIILVHGGPIAEPDDVQYVLDKTRGINGFYGASSMERLPVEIALREGTEKFKAVTLSSWFHRTYSLFKHYAPSKPYYDECK